MTDSMIYRAKKVLLDYRQLVKRIGDKERRLAELMDSATRATPSLEAERVSGTGEHSRLEVAATSMIDLERQLGASLEERIKTRSKIEGAIDAMTDGREARMLELRYIEGKSWASVMIHMEISERTSFRIHESALMHFGEIYF